MRSDGIGFTAPYVLIEGACPVRQNSALSDDAQVMVIEQAMGLPAARGEAAEALLKASVESAKASGFVAQALRRHGIAGATVAPSA